MNLSERLAKRQAPPGTLGRCRRVHRVRRRRPRTAPGSAQRGPVRRREAQRAPGSAGEPRAQALRRSPRPSTNSNSRSRKTLQTVLQRDDTPMTAADRARVAQEIADDILGHGPLEPFLRDAEVTEIMVNGPRPDLRRARRPARARSTPASPTRATCAAPSTRSSAGSAAGSTRPARWSTPGCPTAAGSTPCPADRAGRLAAHDPEVRRRPVHGRRPDRVRHADAAGRATSSRPACAAG